jgi:Tfp pilus assembly protein PilF
VELGLALRDAGQPDQAREALSTAIATGRASASAWRFRGVLALQAGDLEAARADLEQAVALEPRNRDNLYQLANVLYRSGEREAADRLMERVRP